MRLNQTSMEMKNEKREIAPGVFEAAPDMVNHPPHYRKHPSGVECMQVTEHMTFNIGNAMKYLWRAGEKGDQVEDPKKAVWYINREIFRITGTHNIVMPDRVSHSEAPDGNIIDEVYFEPYNDGRVTVVTLNPQLKREEFLRAIGHYIKEGEKA